MWSRLKKAAVASVAVLVALLAGAQLVRPAHTNPATDSTHRKAVNFSEWGAYSAAQRSALLVLSCLDATQGKMPMSAYLRFRPDAKLPPETSRRFALASRQPEPSIASNAEPH